MNLSRIIAALLLALVAGTAAPVFGACSINFVPDPPSLNFGSRDAVTVATTYIVGPTTPAGYIEAECTSTLSLSLLSPAAQLVWVPLDQLRIVNGTRYIDLQMSLNSNFSMATSGPGTTITQSSFDLLGLTLLGSRGYRISFHLRTLPTTTWPKPGLYTGTFRASFSGQICTLGIGLCVTWAPISPNEITTFDVSLTVPKYCQFISVPSTHPLGTVGMLSQFVASNIAVQMRCGQDEDFVIYATNGANYSAGSRRLGLSGQYIRYDLAHPGSPSTPLGNSAATGYSAIATGLAQTLQFPVTLPSGQSTPSAGTYTDSVMFVIEY